MKSIVIQHRKNTSICAVVHSIEELEIWAQNRASIDMYRFYELDRDVFISVDGRYVVDSVLSHFDK